MSNDDFVNRRRELIKHGEGCISHMYLDTVGKVTVGVGNMLPAPEAAIELPFIDRDTGVNATETEIRAGYKLVANQEPKKLAASYKQYSSLDLTADTINELLDRRITEFESGLQRDFADYDSYPDSAKLALIDMAFNLGNVGLVNKFPSFTYAARQANWAVCAQECQRTGISDERNKAVKELLSSIV